MGRKARLKQAPPKPLPGSDMDKTRRKRGSAAPNPAKAIKASKPAPVKRKQQRVKAVDRVDDDSDAEDALEGG